MNKYYNKYLKYKKKYIELSGGYNIGKCMLGNTNKIIIINTTGKIPNELNISNILYTYNNNTNNTDNTDTIIDSVKKEIIDNCLLQIHLFIFIDNIINKTFITSFIDMLKKLDQKVYQNVTIINYINIDTARNSINIINNIIPNINIGNIQKFRNIINISNSVYGTFLNKLKEQKPINIIYNNGSNRCSYNYDSNSDSYSNKEIDKNNYHYINNLRAKWTTSDNTTYILRDTHDIYTWLIYYTSINKKCSYKYLKQSNGTCWISSALNLIILSSDINKSKILQPKSSTDLSTALLSYIQNFKFTQENNEFEYIINSLLTYILKFNKLEVNNNIIDQIARSYIHTVDENNKTILNNPMSNSDHLLYYILLTIIKEPSVLLHYNDGLYVFNKIDNGTVYYKPSSSSPKIYSDFVSNIENNKLYDVHKNIKPVFIIDKTSNINTVYAPTTCVLMNTQYKLIGCIIELTDTKYKNSIITKTRIKREKLNNVYNNEIILKHIKYISELTIEFINEFRNSFILKIDDMNKKINEIKNETNNNINDINKKINEIKNETNNNINDINTDINNILDLLKINMDINTDINNILDLLKINMDINTDINKNINNILRINIDNILKKNNLTLSSNSMDDKQLNQYRNILKSIINITKYNELIGHYNILANYNNTLRSYWPPIPSGDYKNNYTNFLNNNNNFLMEYDKFLREYNIYYNKLLENDDKLKLEINKFLNNNKTDLEKNKSHVICGYICDEKKFICDSNSYIKELDWGDISNLENDDYYKEQSYNYISYNLLLYKKSS